ncbi:hypothetical protein C6P95_25135 [Burkholderia multivorans]|nr:hypothetical protein C6P95_25135 [Burkholderia multivorans]
MDETLGGALPGVPDAPCMNGCKATEQTAPSPADEQTAFEKVFPMPADCQRIGSGPTAGYAPTEYGAWEAHDFIRRWEGWKARAAASPAAHVAPFLLDSQQPAQADTIQCQAHSGPDCTECGGTGIWPARADARAPWPMLEPLHLEAIVFAYNEGYSKAYDGRSFPNPFAESGSQAAAWVLGTRDGNEARVKSEQPPAQADAPAEAREPSKLLAEVWDSALEQAKTNPALLAKLRAAIGSATADAGEARLTDDLRTEFEWCLAEGNIGPRTRAAIQRLLNGAEQ